MDMRVTPRRAAAVSAAARAHPLVLPDRLFESWLEMMPPRQAATLLGLHRLVLSAGPGLVPSIKWGNLVYLYNGRALLSLTPYRQATHLALVQVPGPRRPPPRPVRGPDPRVLRFRHGSVADGDPVLLDALRRSLVPLMR
ncbi:MAG: DUF1801 domain-containing protein [Burkholderiaceae bacterium]|nr:DUF1801 domain-containing protein [Burkholderiaceae bacterium]